MFRFDDYHFTHLTNILEKTGKTKSQFIPEVLERYYEHIKNRSKKLKGYSNVFSFEMAEKLYQKLHMFFLKKGYESKADVLRKAFQFYLDAEGKKEKVGNLNRSNKLLIKERLKNI